MPEPRPLRVVLAEAGVEPGDVLTGEGPHVSGVTHDSRLVQPGDLYAALPGFVTHGARFAAQAVSAGAVAILTDPAGLAECSDVDVPCVSVADPRGVLGDVAAAVYGHPARALTMIGITGTNGKTTTCQMVAAGLRASGRTVGVIGTAGIRIGNRFLEAARTTPEATDLHALLAIMRDEGVAAVAMEVSSHALALGRVGGVEFDIACFTNLTQDHLDFHGTMDAYFAAKSSLFEPGRVRTAVIAIDDDYGRRLARSCGVPMVTCALDSHDADWSGEVVSTAGDGQEIRITDRGGAVASVQVGLPGRFNAANALTAWAILRSLDVPTDAISAGLSTVRVPGRMEVVAVCRNTTFLVDYAHSPDAVQRVLESIRSTTRGKVLCVIGCGGDRDRDKRPIMGRIAAELCDIVVITDDNPRSEDPSQIRLQMLHGVDAVPLQQRAEVLEIGDRRQAIRAAVRQAAPGDVVIVLGKGHERGQEVAGIVHPFDDRTELSAAVAEVAA